ncbi:MAG: hypothetical protein AAF687_08155 [Pseudomonadota bacterium]
MRYSPVLLAPLAALLLPQAASATTETRAQYLERLREVCEVDCMQPRQFQRTARKRGNSAANEMAIIMDVAYVRRAGDKIELHNVNLESSYFEDLQILGGAGIDTSSRTGIGGLPRGRTNRVHPNVIIIEFDQQALFDLFNEVSAAAASSASDGGDDEDILVEGEREREVVTPKMVDIERLLRNRRIVVRGKPRLQPAWIGARLDYRRKQVTLEVENIDYLVMLPRYDKDGNPIPEPGLAGVK